MERYVDPNSGAAPQPGGYAGPKGAEKGFAMGDEPLEKEQEPSRYVAPGAEGGEQMTVDEVAEATEAKQENPEEPQGSPEKVLSELDQGDSASTLEVKPGEEEQANDDQSVEHQALDPRDPESEVDSEAEGEGDEEEEVSDSYDPSKYSVEQVKDFIAANPDQEEAVKAAERAGKGRKTITGD